jgi:hypothetical protein
MKVVPEARHARWVLVSVFFSICFHLMDPTIDIMIMARTDDYGQNK